MFNGNHTYLWLNVFTILFPLLLSFDRKVAFYKKWRFLFPGMLITGAVFIVWDVWFTKNGVWVFNHTYLLGPQLFGLPLEEWLFFVTVPYACTFIYECLRCWFQIPMSKANAAIVSYAVAIALTVTGLIFLHRAYTSITFIFLGFWFVLQHRLFKEQILRNFIPAYGISLLPFLLVNGVLTAKPVVMYNNAENLGLRLFTIPFEDIWYGMLLVLMNITFFEIFRNRKFVRKIK